MAHTDDRLSLEDLIEAFEECGFDSTMPIAFRYDGLALGIGEIHSNDITGNTVHVTLEEEDDDL